MATMYGSDRNGKIQEDIEFDPESRSFFLDFFTSGLLLLFSVSLR